MEILNPEPQHTLIRHELLIFLTAYLGINVATHLEITIFVKIEGQKNLTKLGGEEMKQFAPEWEFTGVEFHNMIVLRCSQQEHRH